MTDQNETRTHPLRELVFEYLERAEVEGSAVLDELCARVPDQAGALRARIRILHGAGLSPQSAGGAPERLGDFRLLERIGGGGMGVVYRAHDESLGRDVAVKLVRPGELLFPGARERFQREIEAVARLSHPGIVPVYSAGEEGGVPYFAMERVDGCTLSEALVDLKEASRSPGTLTGGELRDAICRRLGVEPTSDDIELFEGDWSTVCARIVERIATALEHAHWRGVLHRDLKPSNVMVTPQGRVMLLDFGLSSAEGGERVTKAGSAMGSLPYMSPEQLEGDWDVVDARSDVYSLGVTLYELLTLTLPFREPSVARMRSAVLDGRPDPVRRVNTGASWELETITSVAMEPDRERRYASAGALAGDLAAALAGRAIAARRSGPLRVAHRWVQRHPARAALVVVLGLVAIGGPLLFGWQERRARLAVEAKSEVIEQQGKELETKNAELAVALGDLSEAVAEARTQRDVAQAQEARAEQNFDSAVAAVDTMLTRIAEEDLRDVPQLHELRRDVLEDALAFYLQLLDEDSSPELKRETARAWSRIGQLHGLLDDAEASEAALTQSIDLYTRLREASPEDESLTEELSRVRQLIALPLRQLYRHDEAETHVRDAIEERDDPDDDLPESVAGDVLGRAGEVIALAQVLRESGRYDEAQSELEGILPELEAIHEAEPDDMSIRGHLGRVHLLLGSLFVERAPASGPERLRASMLGEDQHRRAIELIEPALESAPSDAALRRDLARALMNAGSAMAGRAALADAEPLLVRAVDLSRALCSDYPGVDSYVHDQATALQLLGTTRAYRGQPEEGIEMLLDAISIYEELVASGTQVGALARLASAQLQRAVLMDSMEQDTDEILAVIEQAIALHEDANHLQPGMPQTRMGLRWCEQLRDSVRLRVEEGDSH